MPIETEAMLHEVEAEIERLTRLRDALREASGGKQARGGRGRISAKGVEVIRLAATLRHRKRALKADPKNADLKREVVTLQTKLADAKKRKGRDA
jgi:hypothetical protein